MTSAAILASLGPLPDFEPGVKTGFQASCVVPDDDSEVVRHAAPLDDRARAELREQSIARLHRDPTAVAARERRIAIDQRHALVFTRRRA